jgi:hypothetical protein
MDFPSGEARFAAMLAESGMRMPPEQRPSLFGGQRRLTALLGAPARLEAEPALVFAPERLGGFVTVPGGGGS